MSTIGIRNTIPTIVTLPGQGSGGSSFSSSKSLLFDGSNDYIAVGSYTALDATQTFSISMWIKLPRGGGGYVVGKNNTASYLGRRFTYYITESTIEINTSTLAFRNQSLSLATDTWMHIAMVIDRGEAVQLDRCKIYQNGAPVTNVANSNFAQVAADASPLILGARQIGTTTPVINSPFEGNIDEISIWSNALTSNDVSDIWDNGVPNDLTGETGLINWWRMGENSTFSSQILMPENTNKDKFSNYSMEFDGGTDHVNCGNNSSLQITSDISISCWFKTSNTVDTMVLISKRNSATGFNGMGYQLYISSNKIRFLVTQTGINTYTAQYGTDVTDGQWYHVLCTIDQGNEISISVDGDPPVVTSLTVGTYVDSNTPFKIGYNQVGSGHYYFDGLMDEVSIFNSVKAIGDLWDGSGQPTDLTGESGLVSWWRMGEDAIWSGFWRIPDQIGSNNATGINMDIYARAGEAPNSENNALSYNMDAFDIVSDTPPNP